MFSIQFILMQEHHFFVNIEFYNYYEKNNMCAGFIQYWNNSILIFKRKNLACNILIKSWKMHQKNRKVTEVKSSNQSGLLSNEQVSLFRIYPVAEFVVHRITKELSASSDAFQRYLDD